MGKGGGAGLLSVYLWPVQVFDGGAHGMPVAMYNIARFARVGRRHTFSGVLFGATPFNMQDIVPTSIVHDDREKSYKEDDHRDQPGSELVAVSRLASRASGWIRPRERTLNDVLDINIFVSGLAAWLDLTRLRVILFRNGFEFQKLFRANQQ